MPPLGLEKELVALPVGEADDLVFDARAVAGAAGVNLAGEHRGPVEVGPDQVMDRRRGPGDPAGDLRLLDRIAEKGERLRLGIARLLLEPGVVDRAAGQPAGRAGLEAVDLEARRRQRPAQAAGGALPCPTAGSLRLAGVHHGLEKRPGRQHDRPGPILGIAADPHADDPPGRAAGAGRGERFDEQFLDRLLPEVEVGRLLDEPLDLHLVELLVGLGPRPVHRRPLGAVEDAKLDTGRVDRPTHDAAEGVDLANELGLANTPDRRIATHLADGVAVGRQQGRGRAEPGGGSGRLDTGMAGSNHDHVVVVAGGHRGLDVSELNA